MRGLTIGLFFPLLLIAIACIYLPAVSSAAPALPPRPTLIPTPENRARILLDTGAVYENAWTVVQWQGGDGVWHDVEGWQGHVRNGQVRWRVAPKDFSTGPFRWVVYSEADGVMLALSGSFTLPDSRTHTVTIRVQPAGHAGPTSY